MKVARVALGMMMMAGLAACGAAPGKAPYERLPAEAEMHRAAMAPVGAPQAMSFAATEAVPASLSVEAPAAVDTSYRLASFEVRVPKDLTVSEANLYYPLADIVWRGDAYGNRKEQVASFFQNSLEKARGLPGEGRAVKAEITLKRFHALTEKTRYTVGGVHNIVFLMTLTDAQTGQVLVRDREVTADLKGFGGRRAMEAERQGLTQRVRIQHHLDRVIQAEVTRPGGWGRKDRALERAVDQI